MIMEFTFLFIYTKNGRQTFCVTREKSLKWPLIKNSKIKNLRGRPSCCTHGAPIVFANTVFLKAEIENALNLH